jgi:Icc-related predicted phosphoesterase
MQIVQLSDIHIGNMVFDTVVEEINKLKPDTIIIIGDLTGESLIDYALCCKALMLCLGAI